MNIKSMLLIAVLTAGSAGCLKKEELPDCPGSCTVVTGRLLTSGGVPLPGAPVTLQWVGGSGSFGPRSHKKAVGRTDADGRYRLRGFLSDEELADGYVEVVFSPSKSSYYMIGEPNVAFLQPRRDTTYTCHDFLIPRRALLKLVVTNPSQIPSPYAFYADFNSCYGGNLVFSKDIVGGAASVSLWGVTAPYTLEVPADQPILVKYRKNGAYLLGSDTLTVAAGTTADFSITY